jgi:hypothetical protein
MKNGEEVTVPALTKVERHVCDGKTSWVQYGDAQPIQTGRTYCPGWLPGSPLMSYNGTKWLKLVERAQLDGRDIYQLTDRTSDEGGGTDYYLDAKTYLVERTLEKNNGYYTELLMSNYRKIDGVMFPFCVRMRTWPVKNSGPEATAESRQPADSAYETHRIEKIDINIPLDDSWFMKPVAGGGNAEKH